MPYDFFDCEAEHLVNMPHEEMSVEKNELKQFFHNNFDMICDYIRYKFEEKLSTEFKEIFHEKYDAGKKERYLSDPQYQDTVRSLYTKYDKKFQFFKTRYLSRDKDLFVPRIVYGMYLREKFFSSVKQLIKNGVKVNLLPEKVNNIQKDSDCMIVTTDDNSAIKSDKVIVATGHWNRETLHLPDSVTHHIFPSSKLKNKVTEMLQKKITTAKHEKKTSVEFKIGIMGTGLSGIDAVKTIFSTGHMEPTETGIKFSPQPYIYGEGQAPVKINVTMFSRTGAMPSVRGEYFSYKNQHLTDLAIDKLINQDKGEIHLIDVAELMLKDMQAAHGTEFDKNHFLAMFNKKLQRGNDPINILKEDYYDAKDSELHKLMWQTVYHQASSENIFIKIKNHLPADESLYFDRFLKTHHLMHLAPMPQKTAEELLAFHDAGVLDVRSIGHTTNITSDNQKSSVINSDGSQIDFDLLIKATGQDTNVANNQSSLFQDLFHNHNVKTDNQHVTRSVDYMKTSPLAGIEKLATERDENGDFNFFYPTGGVQRTEKLNCPDNENIYIIGVASSAQGVSRASRVIQEGKQVANEILNALEASQ